MNATSGPRVMDSLHQAAVKIQSEIAQAQGKPGNTPDLLFRVDTGELLPPNHDGTGKPAEQAIAFRRAGVPDLVTIERELAQKTFWRALLAVDEG